MILYTTASTTPALKAMVAAILGAKKDGKQLVLSVADTKALHGLEAGIQSIHETVKDWPDESAAPAAEADGHPEISEPN